MNAFRAVTRAALAAMAAGSAVAGAIACSHEAFVEASDAGAASDASDTLDASDALDDAARPTGLACGATTCRALDEVCCIDAPDAWKLSEVLGTASARCVPYGQCEPPAISLRCTTPSFCGEHEAGVCCMTHNNVTRDFVRSDCVQPGSCDPHGPNNVLCDPAAPTACTAPQVACSALMSGVNFDVYGVCHP
jgi:hypothetical protein